MRTYYIKKTQELTNSHKEERPLLLDITEEFLSGPISAVDQNNQHKPTETLSGTQKILWYNKPRWISLKKVNSCLKTCVYTNCESFTNISLFRQSSAVIFCTTTTGIGKMSPQNPTERLSAQSWIFFGMESPIYMARHYQKFRRGWLNAFNWSMNYRLDSDIIIPYGFLKTRNTFQEQNYTTIFRTKTKFAAWVVSHCRTVSLRENFVEKMKQYGVEVDVFGGCGQRVKSGLLERINNNYKFYIGFENTICSDYVTEKFFRYYNLNTIVLVRGGADYKRLLPRDTYINTADFKSVKQLVSFLKYVGTNETLYTSYLKRKNRYTSFADIDDVCPSFCTLCRKVNNPNKYRKVYKTIPSYLETCHKPKDIY